MGMDIRLGIITGGMLAIGALGTAGAATLAVPDWRAAHGGGRTGTFTLTRPLSCDRWEPPRQRCDWSGDFVSDDGTVVRRDRELSGDPPPGARPGDTIPARDAGSWTRIYQRTDTGSWKSSAEFLAIFAGIFLLGAILAAVQLLGGARTRPGTGQA
jgi:hypothetical protein